ncbi:MAG: SPFH domain-containing protein [Steroidobacteraceae bacterium]
MNTPADSDPSKEPIFPRSHRLIRHLALLYGIVTLAVAVFLVLALLPPTVLPEIRAMAREAVAGGLGAMVLPALLLALTALTATLALTTARFRYSTAAEEAAGAASARRLERREDPGFAGRMGQAFIVPAGAVCIWVAITLMWPASAGVEHTAGSDIVAALVFGIAFVSLVCERVMNAFPQPQLPEAPTLRRLLLLATLILAAAACIELGHGAGLGWLHWPELVVICIPGVVAAELAIRALARLFLPQRAPEDARAVTDSIVVALITGGPRAPANLLRTQFGLDFARSWALSFLTAAALPALAGTALLCWCLSGLKLIDWAHRGIYERFGAPVAVLGPGLHLLLPWPLGRLRPVEYGAIHAVPIGVDESTPEAATGPIGAEAPPPVTLNRLWETAHADQAHYLVPSLGTAKQSFQSVSTEIYVLYRVGLTNAAALQSVYTVADPQSLIAEAASRLVLRYFNSRTLDQVIGAERENVAGTLQAELAADPAIHGAGIDIVSVLIEEIHPPEGAAAAYHAVQAAQINALASISNEKTRAESRAAVAQAEAHQLDTVADARAVEIVHAADADAYRFDADRRAYDEGQRSFLLERTFSTYAAALSRTHITLVDHRLKSDQRPILDLRELAVAPPAGEGTGSAQSGVAASSSTPPLTPAIVPTE